MLTVEKSRKLLGEAAEKITDEEVEAVRDDLYLAANLAFQHWRESSTRSEAIG